MKLPLPKFGKSKAGDDEPKTLKPMPQLGGPVRTGSLGVARMRLLGTSVVLLGLLAAFVFQLMSGYITRAIENESDVTSNQVTARVAAMVDYYGSSVALIAKDPEIAALFTTGGDAALRAREESLRYVFPEALNVRLLPPGMEKIDLEASPPLSYASVAQMRAAERELQAPLVEVHLLNSPQQHVNIVRRVMDPAGSGIVGHIMLSLSNEVLQEALDGLQAIGGYVELQQAGSKGRPPKLVSSGDAQMRDGKPDIVLPVPGSRWQVAYWQATGALSHLAGILKWVLLAFVVAAALVAFLITAQFRRLNHALDLDKASLVTLIKDLRNGRVRQEYPSGLSEMNDTVEFMTQLAGGSLGNLEPAPNAPREHDPEYTQQESLETAKLPEPDMKEGVAADYSSAVPSDNLIVEEETMATGPESGGSKPLDASIFRAYDIRGVVDMALTENTVRLIGLAVGSEALQRGRDTVVVGRDGRLSGPKLAAALVDGITATGCNVKDIGCVPTPVLYFATHYLDTHTGVIVTGSHNPPEYNGLKIVIDGETLSGESIQQLRERIEAANFISGKGSVETMDIVPDYVERIRGDVTIARPLKVVVDCGNGVAGAVLPQLLDTLGCKVTELYCDVDGTFPNHHPDPSKPENLKDLINAVREYQADIGLAFDGDGDRLGVVTSAGDVIWPDRVLMLYAMDILKRNPGGQIIYDVKCTRFLEGIIREHGGDPLMWKTGHSFIKAKMKESGALLAGEMSGHIFIKERWYGFDDGLYAAARLLEILSQDMRSSMEVFADLPDSVNTPELNVQMQEGQPPVFMKRLLENAHFESAKVSTIDGLRADFDDGWGLVRASNTTPVLVLRFEADNDVALSRIMGEFRRVMVQVDPTLSLPF